MKPSIRLLRNPHFWGIVAIFAINLILHYPTLWPVFGRAELTSLFGLQRHAIERILFLVPIVYAAFAFGIKSGIICLIAVFAAMLPRVVLFSVHPRDALFETCLVVAIGVLINWWLEERRRETGRREQALLKLEVARRELQSHIQVIRENERRLSALHSISATVNQSLALEEVLDIATNKVEEVMDIDMVFIFLVDDEAGRLDLRASRGASEELAAGVTGLRIGEGFNGWVAQTGQACFAEDVSQDPRLSREVVRREGIKSVFIVPLKSKGKLVGTLCVATRTPKRFTPGEKELLTLIGIELGVAAEKASFLQELQLYADQISRAHEEERKRIARELHDDTIQIMVAISRNVDNFISKNSGIPRESLESLEGIQEDIDESLIRMRRFVQDLRPPTLEYLGLLPALRELVTQVQDQSGIEVHLNVEGPEQHLTPEEELLIYRIVQEAMRNMWKHSSATRSEIKVSFDAERTTVAVSDNGKGFEVTENTGFLEAGKLGLMGMRERAHLLGGTLEIISEPNEGTKVILRLSSRDPDHKLRSARLT